MMRLHEQLRCNADRLSRWVCFLTSLVVTFSLYPGWFFFDSAKQWQWARQIAVDGLPSPLKAYNITSHWPIFNTLIDVPFYWLTGEAGFYIFIQALLFNLSLYLLGAAILGRKSIWLIVFTLVMVLSPISMNYSVFQSSDTIVAICALVAVTMIIDNKLGMARRTWLLAAAVLVMSLVRYNALPAAFLLVCMFFWATRERLGRARSGSLALAILVLVGLGVGGARAYEHTANMRDSAAGGVALRLLDASRYTSDPVVHALVDPYVAANPKLRQPLTPDCYAHGGWCAQMNSTPWRHLATGKFMRAYVRLLVHHPLVFIRVTYHFGIYQLGLAAPLQPTQIGNADKIRPPFPAARMTFNHRRLAFKALLQDALDAFGGLAARAGIICLLGFIAALLLRQRALVMAFVVLAVGYLGPLLLLAGTNNFRYTFPVTIVAMAILAAACCVWVRFVVMRVRTRGGLRTSELQVDHEP